MLAKSVSASHENIAYLSTSFALVGLLASMYTLVHSKCGSLDKLLAASRVVANMRPNTAVNPL